VAGTIRDRGQADISIAGEGTSWLLTVHGTDGSAPPRDVVAAAGSTDKRDRDMELPAEIGNRVTFGATASKRAPPGGIAHGSNKSSLPVKRAGLGGKREIKRPHITTERQVAVTFGCDSEQRV